MPATATAVKTFALWVSPTGTFRLLHWDATSTPDHALGCDTACPVDLTTQLIMWVDDDAFPLGKAPNKPAHALLGAYQSRPVPHLLGEVLFTGSTDAEGTTFGLTLDQALILVDRYLQRIALLPRQRNRR
ncbi:DUF3846 domain-containing protein [Streptomyces niveus]|uniref:DUF3846 domain-containing protein n=1 Tax=Streptomyces niveus TaxID=193462 RepID=UPI0035DBA586